MSFTLQKALGGVLLTALEKKDAEELTLLRSSHEIAMLKLVRDTRKQQIAEAEANIAPGKWLRWLYAAGAVILAIGLWRLRQRSTWRIEDSPEFQDALAIWGTLVATKQNTPLALKRFTNRVRFLAMRLRALGAADAAMSEPDLMALSAIDWYEPETLREEHKDGIWVELDGCADPVAVALTNHKKRFGGLPGENDLLRYRTLAYTVHVS